MSDDELMRLAAIAYGAKHDNANKGFYYVPEHPILRDWQPLENNEDAFMLMAKLKINLTFNDDFVCAQHSESGVSHYISLTDTNDNLRKAIVTCAALLTIDKNTRKQHD